MQKSGPRKTTFKEIATYCYVISQTIKLSLRERGHIEVSAELIHLGWMFFTEVKEQLQTVIFRVPPRGRRMDECPMKSVNYAIVSLETEIDAGVNKRKRNIY